MGRIPEDLSRPDRMRGRLATKAGKRAYLQRQASVEPVSGTTKSARGLQQFQHRRLEKNHHLWRFDMAVHNLMNIIRRLQATIEQPEVAPRKGRNLRTGTPHAASSPA